MNIQQIMVKIGVDGTAVKTGLAKVGSLVKAWGQELAVGMKEYMGSITKGFLGAELVTKSVEYFGEIKNKILEISRASKETGASTNFIQSMMLEAEKSGLKFDDMAAGLARFNHTLGAAKMGEADAIKKFSDIGIIQDVTKLKTMGLADAFHNLGVRFDSLNDKQKQAYVLSQAFGRGYDSFFPIFNRGVANIDKMNQGSFFTKIDKGAINDFQTLWSSIKSGSTATMATIANIVDIPFKAVAKVSYGLGLWSKGIKSGSQEYKDMMKHRLDEEEKFTAEKSLQAMADKEGIGIAELKAKVLQEQSDLLQKQAEIQADINDRDKESVKDMAEQVRKITHMKGPLELMSHTITPRMMTAYKIENLEERSKAAWLMGKDAQSQKLQGEADQIRKSNPWLKRMDLNPMANTERELELVNRQLEPVKRMAELVVESDKK